MSSISVTQPLLAVSHDGDPAWLADARTVARSRAAERGLPTSSEEEWRYSRIDDLDLGDWSPVHAATDGERPQWSTVSDDVIAGAAAIVDIVDGIASIATSDSRITVVDAAQSETQSSLGSVMVEPTDALADLALVLAASPIEIRIPRGAVIEGPIVVRHHVGVDGAAIGSRLTVVAGENSEATIVEAFESADVRSLLLSVTELAVEQASRLRYLVVQDLGDRMWHVASQVSDIGRDAHLASSAVALGGDYARQRTDTRMIGRGAEGDITAVYFGQGSQSLDFRTFQTHVASHTNSELVFKGAVDDSSRSIYTGLIRIEPDASAVEAHQTNRNIKLSEHAWAESVPNLEIENNDVKCSHASAVGPIDADQRFYLESRGVPTEVAERLVVQGFFSDIVSQLPHQGVAAAVDAELTKRLQDGLVSGGHRR